MGNSVSAMYSNFIVKADRLGMPVTYLRDIQSDWSYSFSETDGIDEVGTYRNVINLNANTIAGGNALSIEKPQSSSGAVQTIYHESVHAWMDIKGGDKAVKDLIKNGETYYKSAPLEDKTSADDEERIVQEAVASYVGDRVANWFNTMQALTLYKGNTATDPLTISKKTSNIKNIKASYLRGTAARVFGYQFRSNPGWTLAVHQVETTKPISSDMKSFCDRTILENKYEDLFARNAPLVGLWNELRQTFPDIGDP